MMIAAWSQEDNVTNSQSKPPDVRGSFTSTRKW
jgi:hypothetical protein